MCEPRYQDIAPEKIPELETDSGVQIRIVAGEIDGDTKVFNVALRVLDDSVREIPALPYAYFDPEVGEYRTALSRPIALSRCSLTL